MEEIIIIPSDPELVELFEAWYGHCWDSRLAWRKSTKTRVEELKTYSVEKILKRIDYLYCGTVFEAGWWDFTLSWKMDMNTKPIFIITFRKRPTQKTRESVED